MPTSTCPSCGHPTLETLEIRDQAVDRDGARRDPAPGPDIVLMFECTRCLWRGNTACLNFV